MINSVKIFFLKLFGIIPRGYYCHFSNMEKVCRYWSINPELPYQENGYCALLHKSDWDIDEECGKVEVTTFNKDRSIKSKTMEDAHIYRISMLWDKLKVC